MLSQILQFLLDTIFGFFVFVLLARFYLQLMRAPFRNPLGQFVAALTNWLVLPARRFIPGMFGLDLASFLLAWLIEALPCSCSICSEAEATPVGRGWWWAFFSA